jgi:hypothetical protein
MEGGTVTLAKVLTTFREWLTTPVSPLPLALFRILFGMVLLANCALLYPDLDTWFSEGAMLPSSFSLSAKGANVLDVFQILGDGSPSVNFVFWCLVISSALMAAGLMPQVMAAIVYVALVSLHSRNVYVFHSGDSFLRIAAFMMIFAPSGAALSVDCILRGHRIEMIRPEFFRALQFQLCLVYAATFVFKAQGKSWIDGSAVYLVHQLTEFRNLPLPDFLRSQLMSKFQTWGTLVIEGMFPVMIWFQDTRRIALASMVLLHLGIEYTMSIQLFEWTFIAALALFLSPTEIESIIRWLKTRTTRRNPPQS